MLFVDTDECSQLNNVEENENAYLFCYSTNLDRFSDVMGET